MRFTKHALPLLGFATWVMGATASAQPNPNMLPAYVGITGTPIAAVAPLLHHNAILGDDRTFALHGRYSVVKEADDRAYAGVASAEIPLGPYSLSLHAGVRSPGSSTQVMVGLDVSAVASNRSLDPAGVGQPLVVGVRPEFGFGRATGEDVDETYFSAGLNMPMSVSTGREIVVAAFVMPGVAMGVVKGDGFQNSGMAFSAAAGAMVHNPEGLGLTLSVRRLLVDGAAMVVGAGLTWNRR